MVSTLIFTVPAIAVFVVVALALSFVPLLGVRDVAGSGPAATGTLVAMHLVTFALCVGLLPRVERTPNEEAAQRLARISSGVATVTPKAARISPRLERRCLRS